MTTTPNKSWLASWAPRKPSSHSSRHRHLMTLAKHIQDDSDLTEALTVGAPATAVAALRERSAYVAASLDDYLARYGDRLAGEQKLETVSLQEDPSFLAIALRNFVADEHLSSIDLQDRHLDRRAEFEREVIDKLTGRDRRKLRSVLRRVRSTVEARENMRFTRTRLLGAMRAIYTDAGRRMAAAGLLDDPRQIFYLTIDELHAHAEGRSVTVDLAALARQRYKEFTAYTAEEPPNQFETYGLPGTGRRVSPECAPATADNGGAARNRLQPGDRRRRAVRDPGSERRRRREGQNHHGDPDRSWLGAVVPQRRSHSRRTREYGIAFGDPGARTGNPRGGGNSGADRRRAQR